MEARVVLRAAAALDLSAIEYSPSHDRRKSEANGECDNLPTPQTTEGFREAALFGRGAGWEALRRRRRRRRRRWRRLIWWGRQLVLGLHCGDPKKSETTFGNKRVVVEGAVLADFGASPIGRI